MSLHLFSWSILYSSSGIPARISRATVGGIQYLPVSAISLLLVGFLRNLREISYFTLGLCWMNGICGFSGLNCNFILLLHVSFSRATDIFSLYWHRWARSQWRRIGYTRSPSSRFSADLDAMFHSNRLELEPCRHLLLYCFFTVRIFASQHICWAVSFPQLFQYCGPRDIIKITFYVHIAIHFMLLE